MNKKNMRLGILMVTPLTVFPLIAVSCGDSAEPIIIITGIKAKPTMGSIINEIWTTYEEKSKEDKIASLNILFENIKIDNFDQFEVITSTKNVITLKTLKGYEFENKVTSIDSIMLKVIEGIKPISVSKTTINNIRNAYETQTDDEKISSLKTLFIGINIDNFKLLKVVTNVADKITLMAIDGYEFENKVTSIESQISLEKVILPVSLKEGFTLQQYTTLILEYNKWKETPDVMDAIKIFVDALNKDVFTGVGISHISQNLITVNLTADKITLTINDPTT
ncbi:MAG: hypothetical protein KFW07_01560, partial [Mycoplasmataceae bacterium]|nr:hypothetical protein [Mycoplasmataceae bacterium]